MIALSFDIEEFDLPLEHGIDFPVERQMAVSRQGASYILDILARHGIKATFFSTVSFAEAAPDIISRLLADGHELASHGMQHSQFEIADLQRSRQRLSEIAGRDVIGYRQARMMKLDEAEIARAGYKYDSSLNPTFIPGRYMHLTTPRLHFWKDGVLQIPSAVTPLVRFPLFWISAHVLPQKLYRALVRHTLRHSPDFVTYFHPWEFYDLTSLDIKLPAIVRHNAGEGMRQRLDALIADLKGRGYQFATLSEVYRRYADK